MHKYSCDSTDPAGGLYRLLTPTSKAANIEDTHGYPPKTILTERGGSYWVFWHPFHSRRWPELVVSVLGSRHLTSHTKPLIFDTKLFSRAVTKYSQPKISTRKAGFVGTYLKEGKTCVSTCLSTVPKSLRPHTAPPSHPEGVSRPQLTETFVSLSKATENMCIEQTDEPQSSPNNSGILPSSPQHQPQASLQHHSIQDSVHHSIMDMYPTDQEFLKLKCRTNDSVLQLSQPETGGR